MDDQYKDVLRQIDRKVDSYKNVIILNANLIIRDNIRKYQYKSSIDSRRVQGSKMIDRIKTQCDPEERN